MNVRESMIQHALTLFDKLAAARERETRAAMKCAGCSALEIDDHIAACLAQLAEERAKVPATVAIEIMRVGVPLETQTDG